MASALEYLPEMGRPKDRAAPVGVEHLYPDPDPDLPVELLVNKGEQSGPRGRHWSISWIVGEYSSSQKVQRVLQVVHEIGYDHLTNWGPKTTCFDPEATHAIPIATLSRVKRLALEAIASSTKVRVPNGEWNCQDWIIEVLERAVGEDIVPVVDRDRVITDARR